MNAINLRLVATRAAELGEQVADTVIENADNIVDTVTDGEATKSLGDKVLDTLSNKFVIGGLVAAAAAAVGYGVYRYMKSDDKPAATPAPAPAANAEPELTTEQMVDKARELLTAAESKMKAAKVATPETAKAA
jgi:uncharacterized membrane protein YebE (DUF533 family)